MQTISRVALVLAVLWPSSLPGQTQERRLTFDGIENRRNISAVLVLDSAIVVADDEKGLLVAPQSTTDAFSFGEILPLPAPVRYRDGEYDIEALARSGDFVFAVGSHSAVRDRADRPNRPYTTNRASLEKSATPEERRRQDREWIFRFRLDREQDSFVPRDVVVTSLRPILEQHPLLEDFIGIPSKENGVDIEGLAADGDRLFVGFRGPVLRHGLVPVLELSGFPELKVERTVFVRLGGRGIRDLVKLENGFLVLAGPVGDSDQSYRLYWWDGNDCVGGQDAKGCTVDSLWELTHADTEVAAEGVALLREHAGAYEVLVVFDGISGGSPRVFRIPSKN